MKFEDEAMQRTLIRELREIALAIIGTRAAIADLRDPLERIAKAAESQSKPPALQSIAWHHAEPQQEV
jgi:hypothetical protein